MIARPSYIAPLAPLRFSDYGAGADAAANFAALGSLLADAQAQRRIAVIDEGEWPVRPGVSSAGVLPVTGPLEIRGNGAALAIEGSGLGAILQMSVAATITGRKLAAGAAWKAARLDLADASGIKAGMHVYGESLIAITGVTAGNPTTITAPGHGLVAGDTVRINAVGGIDGLNNTVTARAVTVIDANTFTVPVASTGSYTSGGNARLAVVSPYANYTKAFVSQVVRVQGNRVYLADPLPFHFTAGETSLTFRPARSVAIEGLTIRTALSNARFDLLGLTRPWLRGVTVRGNALLGDGTGVLIRQCLRPRLDNCQASLRTYAFQFSEATRGPRVTAFHGERCLHPVDPAGHCVDVEVRNFSGFMNAVMVQAHPAQDVRYIDGVSQEDLNADPGNPTGGMYFVRSIGALTQDVTILRKPAVAWTLADAPGGTTSLGLQPNYVYLDADNYHVLRRVRAPQSVLHVARGRLSLFDVQMAGLKNNSPGGYGATEINIDADCAFDVESIVAPVVNDSRP